MDVVEPLLAETYELFKAQAGTASITLQHATGGKVPPVYADHHRVLQVLSNLIGNAMKFTPEGGVISFRADAKDDHVVFTVADTGPGIRRRRRTSSIPIGRPSAPNVLVPDSVCRSRRVSSRPTRSDLGGVREGARNAFLFHAADRASRAVNSAVSAEFQHIADAQPAKSRIRRRPSHRMLVDAAKAPHFVGIRHLSTVKPADGCSGRKTARLFHLLFSKR